MPDAVPSESTTPGPRDRRRRRSDRRRRSGSLGRRSGSARTRLPSARRGRAGRGDPPLLPRLQRARGGRHPRDSARHREIADPPRDGRAPGGARRGRPTRVGSGREPGMTLRDGPESAFERTLTTWLAEMSPEHEPADLLERVLATTAVGARRPAWWRPWARPRFLTGRGRVLVPALGLATIALATVWLVLVLAA